MSETNTNPEARVVEAVARAMLAAERCTAISDEYWEILWNDPTSMTAFRIKTLATAAISAHTKALAAEGMVVVKKRLDAEAARRIADRFYDTTDEQVVAIYDAAIATPTLPPAGDET